MPIAGRMCRIVLHCNRTPRWAVLMHGGHCSGVGMRVEAIGKGGRAGRGVGEVMLIQKPWQESVRRHSSGCFEISVQPPNLILQLAQPAALSLPAPSSIYAS